MALLKAIIRSFRRLLKPRKKRRRKSKSRKIKKRPKAVPRRRTPPRKRLKAHSKRPKRRISPKPKRVKLRKPISSLKKLNKVELKHKEKGILVGEITHYFSKIQVCVVNVTKGGFQIGDRLRIQSGGAEFIQKVKSLQVESVDVKAARKGQLVGMRVDQKAGEGALVYKL